MFEAVPSPYLVPYNGSFRVADAATEPPEDAPGKKRCKKQLEDSVEELHDLQRILYAHDHHAVLLVFQAMDAAGKDSTIRSVMQGVDPSGCQVFSFKKPSNLELDHDFLWRTTCRLPERGRIGIFNRSYYEEVLVVRVHPKFLDYQRLPEACRSKRIWKQRFESIRDHEKHLARIDQDVVTVSNLKMRKYEISEAEKEVRNTQRAVKELEKRLNTLNRPIVTLLGLEE